MPSFLKFGMTHVCFRGGNELLQAGIDRAEDLADLATKQGQDTNDNDCDQHQDQRVLDQALALFPSKE